MIKADRSVFYSCEVRLLDERGTKNAALAAFNSNGEPCPIELEYPRRGLLPSEGYYQYFISYKLYPRPQ